LGVTSRRCTDADLAHFGAEGWLLCEGLLGIEVAELQDEVDRVARLGADGDVEHHYELTDGGRRLARAENFTPASSLLSKVLRDGAVPGVAGELLGEPALLYKEKINYKTAGGAGFSPHQDKPAYPFVDQVLSVMIAVDDATTENGCLEVVSGAHHEVLPQDDRGCIAASVVATYDWRTVELRAGQALFFHALTPHRSGPNRSARDRRALYPTYNGRSEGDLRDEYYAERRRALADADGSDRLRLSLIGDFEGRPA
jgi:ectoine hydroxylase-related dioxygenase (phytanoyl-CoA dioxygenase family)